MKVFRNILGLFLLAIINRTLCITQEKLFKSATNKVYYIETDYKYDWFESLTKCARMNMSLLTIDSKIKSDEINKVVKNSFGKNYILWVGGYAVGKSRQFTWIATGEEFTYTFWSGKNPDFYLNNEYCAQIGWGEHMEWNDCPCLSKYGFICEFRECTSNELENQKYRNIIINNYQKT